MRSPRIRRDAFARISRVWARYLTGLLPEERRFWLLVPVTGVASGLLAVMWLHFLAFVEHTAWRHPGSLLDAVTAAPPWLRLLVPYLGGLLVVIFGFLFRSKQTAHGTSGLIATLLTRGGHVELIQAFRESFLSITVVGMGASLGREGGLIHSGAAMGSWLGMRFRLEERHVKILLAAGAAGGIAAAYDAPIGGSVFAMEVLLGTFALELFGPIIICSAIATTITRRLLGEPPPYVVASLYGQAPVEMLLDVALGVGMGLVSVAFIRIFTALDTLFAWLKRFDPAKPVLVMSALGLAGIAFPDLYGNGYDTVNRVLAPGTLVPLHLLVALAVLKIFFTALCRAGGITGGLLTPSLFIGALLGSAFGSTASLLMPWTIAPPPTYALMGMAAILAGTMQAPITAVLMIFEMTSDYGIILPLMVTSVASTLICHLFQRESIYTEPLRRRGLALPHRDTPTWLRQPIVRDFLNTEVETIAPETKYDDVVERFMSLPAGRECLYVVDEQRAFLGAISLHEIKRWFRGGKRPRRIRAADILDSSCPYVLADDLVSRALELFTGTASERLPVLRDAKSRRLLGTISKRQLLAAYRESNLTPGFRIRRPARERRPGRPS